MLRGHNKQVGPYRNHGVHVQIVAGLAVLSNPYKLSTFSLELNLFSNPYTISTYYLEDTVIIQAKGRLWCMYLP